MTEELTVLDPANHLKSDRAIADFMSAALATNDPGYLAQPWASSRVPGA